MYKTFTYFFLYLISGVLLGIEKNRTKQLTLTIFPDIRWSEIADRFAYEPELFSSPEFIARINQEMASDDPSVYEWDKVRIKRTIPARFMKLHQKQFY